MSRVFAALVEKERAYLDADPSGPHRPPPRLRQGYSLFQRVAYVVPRFSLSDVNRVSRHIRKPAHNRTLGRLCDPFISGQRLEAVARSSRRGIGGTSPKMSA
jgi:hypothetical protein